MSPSLTLVTSPSNPRLKLVRSLGESTGVRKHGLFLMEGPRFVRDYMSRGEGRPSFVLMSRDCTEAALDAAEEASAADVEILCLPGALFSELTDTGHSQGILAVCPLPRHGLEELLSADTVLVLDRVSDPGNVGTAIRSAAAFGCAGVVCGKGTCFPFTPRVTRAAAGLNALLPVVCGDETAAVLGELAGNGFAVVAADAGGRVPDAPAGPRGRTVLVVGSEAHGLSGEILGLADEVVAIPMADGVESLNAGVSASILLYLLTRG